MESRAKLLGHPIHQMLIVLPLGLLTMAVLFDLYALLVGNSGWFAITYWMIAAGVVTGLLAALFGFIDWLAIPANTRAKRIGAVHGLGNVIVVVFFALSWLMRTDGPVQPASYALILSFVAGALAMFTGWLGGELVDRLAVGVHDGANLNAPSSLSKRHA
jgi:uncharacterized membrane protein